MSVATLLEVNRDIQSSPTLRLLATLNLGVYATLMERHLSGGEVPETELVVRIERDLDDLGRPGGEQSGLALVKTWASQGWLHRIADQRAGVERNLCYLTQEARRVLADRELGKNKKEQKRGRDESRPYNLFVIVSLCLAPCAELWYNASCVLFPCGPKRGPCRWSRRL